MVLSMDRWVGKVAIVTGASSGIGAAIAKALALNGMIVVGLARRKENVERLAKEIPRGKGKIYALQCDLLIEQNILDAFEWTAKNFGPVHVLVNNAGLIQNTNLHDGDSQMWKKVIDVNVMALCIASREAVRGMQANKIKGHIININSVLGHRIPFIMGQFSGVNIYPATKHAVTGLTEVLRLELVEQDSWIKVTSVSPGLVQTDILSSAGLNDSSIANVFDQIKVLDPEDVADSVVYALSTPPHTLITELTLQPVQEKF
ncbi:farnesol dehydrogenase-like [Euwallacea similis]|uniref:farnesol dehydrogenase-like n=1 Tax=Euwallacea similis TaxID=1736056 RepID=UPI00344B1136